MGAEYQSSEELHRHHNNDVFARTQKDDSNKNISDREKLKKILDRHIKQHSSTKNVRALAEKNKRTADYQLDLSADLVEMLEKIKKELG